ncbi:hypothetical protein FUSO3_11810 [Fusobacterium necrophorum BL]|uniref:Uncharacterized protein n=1 Tax=Fusobacterium necrophorum BL TaxID=1441732 RepID=A0AB73BT78_9FUSO|nr:hypothetical protein FUSO3_11810 [Fusobacterium necrophorum BL]
MSNGVNKRVEYEIFKRILGISETKSLKSFFPFEQHKKEYKHSKYTLLKLERLFKN